MKKRPTRTLAEVGYANLRAAGVKPAAAINRATDAVSTIARLAYVGNQLGHWPTQAEYADFEGITGRTAQRQWKHVREAFPGEEGPDRLAKLVAVEVGNRVDNLGSAFNAPYEPGLATA